MKGSLRMEGSNGAQRAVVGLQIKSHRCVLGDLMKELKAASGDGNFLLRARLVVLEKGTFKMVAFDVRPKVSRQENKILCGTGEESEEEVACG